MKEPNNPVPEELFAEVGFSVKQIREWGIHKVKLHPRVSIGYAINVLSRNPNVEIVEPNYTGTIGSTPDDTDFSSQYGPKSVQANLAWSVWQPQCTVTIAVIDTGINRNHPDFANKLLVSTTANSDFIDDDKDPEDGHGHGSHVAGIAAGSINNASGIAGIAGWNGYYVSYNLPQGAQILGVGQLDPFDNDPDILFYTSDNKVHIWSLNGYIWNSGADILRSNNTTISLEPGQEVVGLADFDGDGMDEIVFQYPAQGKIEYWTLSYTNYQVYYYNTVFPSVPQ